MITRLGTCQDYYNNTCRAAFLLWSPETSARSRLRRVLPWRSVSDSFVHQLHADILAPNTMLSPGGWNSIMEEDRQMHSFISADREVFLSMATLERRFRCLVEVMNSLAKIGYNQVGQAPLVYNN